MVEVLDADQTDGIGAGLLVGLGAGDDFLEADHPGIRPADDGHFRVDSRLQRRTDLANRLEHADEVGGAATEFGRQQGVLDGQRGNPGALQFGDGAHHVQRIAVAMIGVGQHRQLGDTADTRGLLDELAQSDEVEVRRGEDLQRGHRAAEDAHFETEVGGDARGHRVEHRGGVEAAVGVQQLAKVAAQVVMRESRHIGSMGARKGRFALSFHFSVVEKLPGRPNGTFSLFIPRPAPGGAAHRPCTGRWR